MKVLVSGPSTPGGRLNLECRSSLGFVVCCVALAIAPEAEGVLRS